MTTLNDQSQLDVGHAADTFARLGHVRLLNALSANEAESIGRALDALTNWQLKCANQQGFASIDPADLSQWPQDRRTELNTSLLAAARQGEGFAYFGHTLGKTRPETPQQEILEHFTTALVAPPMIGFVEAITGKTGLKSVTAQATRFAPGHYLTRHTDAPENETREIAFVFGFTPNWHPDWGGLLQFYDRQGTPLHSYAPGFNTLDLFSVHSVHSVTYVAPFAGALRHVISGWFHA